jgi:hypothetical protein
MQSCKISSVTSSELKAIKKGTKNARLLDDYAVWLVNNR